MSNLRDGTATPDWSELGEVILDHPSLLRRRLDERTTSFALAPDNWTASTHPVALVVQNDGLIPIAPVIRLFSAPPPGTEPLTVLVHDETGILREVVSGKGNRRLKLTPVPARPIRLYLLYTDRLCDSGDAHPRKRGVSIRIRRYKELESLVETVAPSSAASARGR